jgi:nudix-type nucleoside diphosphatase (YffH/AdpP family)
MADKILATRSLFKGWMNVILARLRIKDVDVEWPLIEHPSGAAVLAYDPARRVALTVRQTRLAVLHARHAVFPEAIAGVVDDEDPEAAARREAMEEAGVRLRDIELVARVWMTPSSTTERVSLYLGAYGPADRVSQGGGQADENEYIEVREEVLADLWDTVQAGALTDAKLLMALQALRVKSPELFERR